MLTDLKKCPDCGTDLDQDPSSGGLCPRCLLELALDITSLETELFDPGEAPTLGAQTETFSEGQIQGDRYRIRSLLGRGGMGEVWRAYDLKLRQDVALKSLLTEQLQNAGALEALRQEVRVAREVISPNVCRVFDLQEVDGQELVAMEYIDGTTLAEILRERSPLELDEAREIASQFLAGVEAIHDAGLVHRDIKPENIMVTRTGRVVVMDFGIAKTLAEGQTGSVAGTPAYMSPEHAGAGELDARADVFSTGVLLAEMVDPGGTRSFATRRSLWEGLHGERPQIAETPWSRVITRCLAAEPAERFATAAELARALEEVTLRATDEDAQPYPGLAAFEREQAAYFFGRELEVEALWKKLRRPHLLALIGPSGAGKSSFLQAGLLPALPGGWRSIVATPGDRPFENLARALESELGEAPGTAELLPRFDEPDIAVELLSQWRRAHDHAIVIVDQFEELFTQVAPDTQERFAELLGRLPLEADVHVLLSMRDDFLLQCQTLDPLAPIFSEMTPLGAPTGASLRRAIVQPALKCGYRFEDEALVESMLSEVEGERGALPMVAFAAARLWEERDRESGLLTTEAYERIGGVGGALARHAEVTLESIGPEGLPIVRELFRNLVTAQGTRAVRDRDELLSVFGDGREEAEAVLATLIDARLLTSYEVPGDDDDQTRQRIEVIHESLLSAWPRLVRWQAQDADSARMRDQLRQAANLWHERGRPDDLLWSGTAFKEYELWRERYEGGLSATESAFADAMVAGALRGRRRRRVALAVSFAVLLSVLAVVGVSRQQAVAEARRAEAANLYGLAQLRLEGHPTTALAYATASLELADNPEVRRLVLDALSRGPMEMRLPTPGRFSIDFGPEGKWLATAGEGEGGRLWPSNGGPSVVLEGDPHVQELRVSPRGDLVAGNMNRERTRIGLWSIPEGNLVRSWDIGEGDTTGFWFSADGERLITRTETYGAEVNPLTFRSWPVAGGDATLLAQRMIPSESAGSWAGMDMTNDRALWIKGPSLRISAIGARPESAPSLHSLDHDLNVLWGGIDDSGQRVATAVLGGIVRVWRVDGDQPELLRTLPGEGGGFGLVFDPTGPFLAGSYMGLGGQLWNLSAPPEAAPLVLKRAPGAIEEEKSELSMTLAFDPLGRWVASGHAYSVSLWPLSDRFPIVLEGHEGSVNSVEFTPDGGRLLSRSTGDRTVRLWPLTPDAGETAHILWQADGHWVGPRTLSVSTDGSFAAIGTLDGKLRLLPLDGGDASLMTEFTDVIAALDVSPGSHLVAAGAGAWVPEDSLVRVWDLRSGGLRVLDAQDGRGISYLKFLSDHRLFAAGAGTLRTWDLNGEGAAIAAESALSGRVLDVDAEGRQALVHADGGISIRDIESGDSIELTGHGTLVAPARFDPSGEIVVSGDKLGVVRVGRIGDEPHVLLGHDGEVNGVAISPDGRWIASSCDDRTIRLWPMPDLSRQQIHTLPRDELLARLYSLTNFRAVEDPDSPSGWKLELAPFPGWEEVPTW